MKFPEKTITDHSIDSLKILAQLIPSGGIGAAVAQAIDVFELSPYILKKEQFFKELADAFENLPSDTRQIVCTFLSSDEGMTLLYKTLESVLRTHKHEKHRYLSRVLINSSADNNCVYDKKELLLNVITTLEPYDIHMLCIINDNIEMFREVESYKIAFEIATRFGFSQGDKDVFQLILKRLESSTLIKISDISGFGDMRTVTVLSAGDSDKDLPNIKITEFGAKLLEFLDYDKASCSS